MPEGGLERLPYLLPLGAATCGLLIVGLLTWAIRRLQVYRANMPLLEQGNKEN